MAAKERTVTVEDEISVLESRGKIAFQGEPSNAGNEMKCDFVVGSRESVSACVHHYKRAYIEHTKVCIVCVFASTNHFVFCCTFV